MTRTINRRTAIASATALAALAPLPLKAAESDAEIARLFAAHVEAEDRANEAYNRYEEAAAEADDRVGRPAVLLYPDSPRRWASEDSIEELVRHFPPSQRAAKRAECLGALKQWKAALATERKASGVNDLEATAEAVREVCYETWDQLVDTPANTVTGVAIKLAAVLWWHPDLREVWTGKTNGEMGENLMLSARADALRLAGLPHTFGMDEPEGEYVDTGQDGA
jgi:hypothetical protein